MKYVLIISAIAILTSCASLQSPPINKMQKLPVIRVGKKPPPNSEYIVFYPAGVSFKVKLKTKGTLFKSEKTLVSRVKLSRNLYLYKYWASYDGETWMNSHKLLEVKFGGGFDVSGLQVNVHLDAK